MGNRRDYNALAFRTISDRENFAPEELKKRRNAMDVGENIVAEGCVLLKNDGLLPLKTDRVNVFGALSAQPYFGGRGSSCSENDRAIGFYTALEEAGIQFNPSLYSLMKNWVKNKKISAKSYPLEKDDYHFKPASVVSTFIDVFSKPYLKEFPADKLENERMREAAAYSDTAVVMLGRSGSEQHDMPPEELRLLSGERALLDRVCGDFENVLLILNTAGVFELGFAEDYPQIRAVLSIGYPARTGMRAVAKILKGEISPSGRLTDTFWYHTEDHPAWKNTGTYKYKNALRRHFLMYKEDIYVGYRYTETFLAETEYVKKIQYPFGYGLSYTNFRWENATLTQSKEEISVTVDVANTGELPGKDVVEIFVEAPYDGRIEKAKKVLAGFQKSRLLQPGEKQSLQIVIPKYAFASFDTGLSAYVLDAGEYAVLLSADAHTVRCSLSFAQEADLCYTSDPTTGKKLQRRFAAYEGVFQRLSRKDGQGAVPASPLGSDFTASARIVRYPNIKDIPQPDAKPLPVEAADKGIRFDDLRDRSWEDPLWEEFLSQLTVEEMAYLISHGGYETRAIERLGIPATIASDGPAGIHDSVTARAGISYPSGTTVASTWNPELAKKYGESIGNEAGYMHVQEWYGPSMNLHRSPFGGRCFEYYSEDPLLSGKMAAAVVSGAQSKGLVCHIKHFALNEEDKHRLSVHTWCSEQAIREIYAKPFEYAVKEGGAMGVMSALNCVGEDWSGECEALQTGLLREEWNFHGCVVTDFASAKYMKAITGVLAGNDLWLAPVGNAKYEKPLLEAAHQCPSKMLPRIRYAVKGILWMVLHAGSHQGGTP